MNCAINCNLFNKKTIDNDNKKSFHDIYKLGKYLGCGGSGTVYEARKIDNNEIVVVKIIPEKNIRRFELDLKDKIKIPIEVFILKNFEHKNLINLKDYYFEHHFFFIIMENFGDGLGDLYEHIEQKLEIKEFYDETICKYIFKQIVECCYFLSKKSIYHGDIKDENVLIDANYNIKLIDFGSCYIHQNPTQKINIFHGTVNYAPPEVLIGIDYLIEPSEVWKLGCILFVIIFGRYPFKDPKAAINTKLTFPKDREISNTCKKLLHSILAKNPSDRLTIKQIYEHPWLQL